jgi:hypothetical protein
MPTGGGGTLGPINLYAIPRSCFMTPEQIADPSSLLEQARLWRPPTILWRDCTSPHSHTRP